MLVVISIHFCLEQTMFVKIHHIKKIVLEVLSSETISDVKAKIEEKEGIRPKQQRLIFRNRKLDDQRTLADCGVQNGSELFLVLCLCGC